MITLIAKSKDLEVSSKFRAFRSLYFLRAWEELIEKLPSPEDARHSFSLIMQRRDKKKVLGRIDPKETGWELVDSTVFEEEFPKL